MTNDTPPQRSPVTVIGLGAMGSALAGALLGAGHPTTVWNRSPEKAAALVDAGARHAETVQAAVAASPLVIACVLDDDAVRSALGPAAGDFAGRVLVNLTSDTPEEVRATAAWAAGLGIPYVDGKILAFPSTIGTSEAFLLFSGESDAFNRFEPTLSALGGTSYLGDEAGLASLYDLGLLGLMYGTAIGFLHSLALLRAEGIEAESFRPYATDLLAAFPGMFAEIAQQVQSGGYAGSEANLVMQAAYVDHMVEVSETRGVDAAFPRYVKSVMDRAIAAGHGGDDLGRLVEQLGSTATTAG